MSYVIYSANQGPKKSAGLKHPVKGETKAHRPVLLLKFTSKLEF